MIMKSPFLTLITLLMVGKKISVCKHYHKIRISGMQRTKYSVLKCLFWNQEYANAFKEWYVHDQNTFSIIYQDIKTFNHYHCWCYQDILYLHTGHIYFLSIPSWEADCLSWSRNSPFMEPEGSLLCSCHWTLSWVWWIYQVSKRWVTVL
jgi:hypothetical protein